MSPVIERADGVHQLPPGARERLRVTSVNLACCAVEAASALAPWSDASVEADVAAINVLVVAGTVTRANARLVTEAFQRLPAPRAVIAFGVCTISGGPYWDSYAVLPGIGNLVPVDVFVPGCPPRPADLTRALIELSAASDGGC